MSDPKTANKRRPKKSVLRIQVRKPSEPWVIVRKALRITAGTLYDMNEAARSSGKSANTVYVEAIHMHLFKLRHQAKAPTVTEALEHDARTAHIRKLPKDVFLAECAKAYDRMVRSKRARPRKAAAK